MFHRIISLLLIVNVSLAVPFVFMNIACRSTQTVARIKRFLKLHIVIKPLSKKINIINSLLCWSVTLSHSTQLACTANLALVKCENRLAVYRWFWKFFKRFAKYDWSSLILTECNLCCIVKYGILSEVCMINTAPHSTVSPQMWCITSIYERLVYTRPDLLARFGKVNLSNAKHLAWFVCQA